MNRTAEIKKLRDRICALQAERTMLENCGLTRDEVRANVCERVARWHVEGQRHAALDLQRVAAGDMVNMLDVEAPRGIGPLLTRLLGPAALEAALLNGIEALPEGVKRAERLARIAVISRELLGAEMREEALIEQAEAAGEVVWRRADARAEIVIGAE